MFWHGPLSMEVVVGISAPSTVKPPCSYSLLVLVFDRHLFRYFGSLLIIPWYWFQFGVVVVVAAVIKSDTSKWAGVRICRTFMAASAMEPVILLSFYYLMISS